MLDGTTPASGSNDNEPRILGSAEAGTTVACLCGTDKDYAEHAAGLTAWAAGLAPAA